MGSLRQAHPQRWSEALVGDLRCDGDATRLDPPAGCSEEGCESGEDPGKGSFEEDDQGGERREDPRQEGGEGSGEEGSHEEGHGRCEAGALTPYIGRTATTGAGARRGGRGRGTGRLVVRLLAGRRGVGRRGRGEEDVPAREDLRGRADPAGRAPARRHGARGGARRVAPLRRSARLRVRTIHCDAVARAPALPRLRLHHHPPRSRRARRRPRRGRRRHLAAGHRGHRCHQRRDGAEAGTAPHPQGGPGPGEGGSRALVPSQRAMSWSPTAPTRAWAACWARHDDATCHSAWRCAATTRPNATTTLS